jgi:hypothetical protein
MKCSNGGDCRSGSCTNGLCAAPATCSNGLQDAGEGGGCDAVSGRSLIISDCR